MAIVSKLPFLAKRPALTPWLIGLLAVGILGIGLTSWAIARRNAINYDVEKLTVSVERRSVRIRITASGKVQPVRSVNLSPKDAGLLQELLVEQGDRVEQGQAIARMESADVDAEVARAQASVAQAEARLLEVETGNRPEEIAQAEAGVARAQAQLEDAATRLTLAENRRERNQALADEGAISRDALDAALNEAAVARATYNLNEANLQEAREQLALMQQGSRAETVAQTKAQLAEARANLQAARARQDDTIVRAPFGGIVTQKFTNEGAFVTPTTSASEAASASSTAIVAIANGLEVLAEVPEVDVGQIQVGQPVEIVADAYPNQVFRGRVKRVAPEAVVEQNVTSFEVRVELVTGLDRLRSGMNVDATFLGDAVDDALVVPTVGIVTVDGETGVLVPDRRDRIRFRPITVGSAVGNQTQVLDGVKEGDRVFTDLPEGQSLENLNFGRNGEVDNSETSDEPAQES